MKPGLAVLPMDVWADVFVFPWIRRQQLALIVDKFKERAFAEKLQTFLHDPKCGKQTLHYLDISSKRSDKPINKNADNVGDHGSINEFKRFLRDCGKQTLQYFDIFSKPPDETTQVLKVVIPNAELLWLSLRIAKTIFSKECEFPETEMPENIKTFKQLIIRHFDDEVLAFLHKIKPLFNNVFLTISTGLVRPPKNVRILLDYLLPMLASIRRISCDNGCLELFEQHFPWALALAKELELTRPKPASIPRCLNWLNAPLGEHGLTMRFLRAYAEAKTIFAIVDAIRKQFLAATNQSAFAIFLQFYHSEHHHRADEFTIENAATKEQLIVRNAIFYLLKHGVDIHYVEVLRHPMGTNIDMREWIEKRAYFEKNYDDEANKEILIWSPTVGRLTKKVKALDHDKKRLDHGEDEAGPSTPAKKMRKE